MVELADIVRAAGPAYVTAHAGALLPSQRRALTYIGQCRTAALGGSLYRCDDCGALDYRYHSCRNRHCPKCQADRAQQWLERVRARLLPCEYYLLTFTLPAQLRALARRHQRLVYSALLREAAASVQAVAEDRAWIGGTPGILAVLHTWSRTLDYHPHVRPLPDTAIEQPYFERLRGGVEVSKSFRTIKKSAAKSSVSRSKLRTAVKKSSSPGKAYSFSAKKASHATKKGDARKPAAKKASGHRKSLNATDALVHQPSVIRPVATSTWSTPRRPFGSKVR